jgi:hypothetical protein
MISRNHEKNGKMPKETYQLMLTVFGDATMNWAQVFE